MTAPPVDLDAVRSGWEATRSAYSMTLGIVLESLGAGTATMRMPASAAILNEGGAVHGGALASLCDTAFHLAHLTYYGLERPGVTVDLNCTFLNAAFPPHDLVAAAKIVKGGRRLAFGEVSVTSDGVAVAHCTLNFMNLS